ncbi:MAG: hypothetical protein HY897_10500 [Deltaproteobacteria bacterium]|nr:hypothetical protein [Deltaproteobacteria bacterium]
MRGTGALGAIVCGGALLAAAAACDVTANPFELGAQMVIGDDPPDAGTNRPCTSTKDCAGGYVCRSHICVPPVTDGGGDTTAVDGGCVEKMEITPQALDFGTVTQGCSSKDVPVTLDNKGCLRQTVTSFDLLSTSDSMTIGSIVPMPLSMEPGTETEIVLRYRPETDSGTELAVLRVETSIGDLEVPLRGTATSSSDVLDTFVQVSPPSSSFHLSRWPDPATIEVEVNGVGVPEDGGNGWSYDEGGNNVVFGTDAVPAPGAEIAVAYEAMCF